ncbi:MAG: hypothetical protein K8F30_04315, partial [Taibaiella sp.]|nr:hypothetical protein [Taibaiella sp.]
YFPVHVEAASRVIRILFNDVLSFHVISESYSSPQTEPTVLRKIGPVCVCDGLEYRRYVESDSLVEQVMERPFHSYFIWTEDQSLFVLAESDPTVTFSDEMPSLNFQRGATYFSK